MRHLLDVVELAAGMLPVGSGTMIRLMRIAAGAPSTEETTIWPAAFGIAADRIVA